MARPPVFESWTAHGWGIQVKTAHQLFRTISHIALLEQSRTYAWRGQSDAAWPLSSSLYRQLAGRGESVTEIARQAEHEARADDQVGEW